MTQHGMSGRSAERKPSPLFELACVLVRLDHVARFIVNANHGIMRAAAKFRVVECVARLQVPQATEWERIGDEIDDAFVAARGAFRKVLASGLDARLLRLF
jgi:hypothetical protein